MLNVLLPPGADPRAARLALQEKLQTITGLHVDTISAERTQLLVRWQHRSALARLRAELRSLDAQAAAALPDSASGQLLLQFDHARPTP